MLYGLRLAGLVGLFILYVPPHLLSKLVLRKSGWPPRFLRHAGLIAGVRPRLEGSPLEAHTLVIANHTSWLDILILGGWAGSAFVSKGELEHTTLLGWIADQNRTLYIDRAARRDSLVQVQRITEALEHQQPLTVFPEGTTGSGRHLLKFRSTLLEAVAPAPSHVKVRPVAIDYGAQRAAIGWSGGEAGKANVLKILGRRGSFEVVVRLLPPLPPHDDRKALARTARAAIEATLTASTPAELGL